VAVALEGELSLTRDPTARITLLRRLGSHFAHRMGDDAKAEACWKEVLAAVPDDRQICDELIALHRRRGDFEGYDRTVQRQGWRSLDEPPRSSSGAWRR